MVEGIRGWAARLGGWANGAVSGAVLLREAARTSRRWQTYAARAGFSGVLLGVLLAGIWSAVSATRTATIDTADLGMVGRAIFVGFAVVQTLLALVLAPLQTAAAIVEETDERTMEMLVLTKLRPGQILAAKVLSRILLLVTVVCGALPVMALVVNLGGVSTVEVVAVTVHALTTIVVLSALGAFFALFTKSPTLAMAASACYAVPFFAFLPMAYVLCTGQWWHAAHFSTFAAATAKDWTALITPLSYVPSLAVVAGVAVPLFQLKVSGADFRHAFSEDVWRTHTWLKALAGWIAVAVTTLPPAAVVAWWIGHAGVPPMGVATTPVHVLALGWIWLVFSLGAAVGTWAFLRVGMDVTDGIDSVFSGAPSGAASGERPSLEVGRNPVFWREARMRAWVSTTAPVFVTWLLVLLGVFQTGWWLLPGGLLSVGAVNAGGAVLLAVWLAARSVAEERRRGTLEVLLATTLPSPSVVWGKFAAAALPTFPLLLVSLPLVALGVPHARMLVDDDVAVTEGVLRGLASWVWTLPVWGTAIATALATALRTSRPRSAFGLVSVGFVFALGLPSVFARLFPEAAVVTFPALLLAPPLAGSFAWWQIGASTFAWGVVCAALLTVLAARLRPWAGLLAALLALVASAEEARAQPVPDAETIAKMEQLFQLRMAARPIADGWSREGRWTTIAVAVENLGAATTGAVSFDARSPGTEGAAVAYTRGVELPEGGRKELLLLAKPGVGQPERVVRLQTRDGREAVAVVRLRTLGENDVLVAVIGRDPLGIPAALPDATGAPVPGRVHRAQVSEDRKVRAGLVALEGVPLQSAGWGAVDWVVWPQADPTALAEQQVEALRAYVADGGHLLVTVTDTWRQVVGSPLDGVLPVELLGQGDADVGPLSRALGGPRAGSAPVAVARLRPGAVARAAAPDGSPLWVSSAYGLGSVHVVLADLSTAPLDQAKGERGWRELLTLPAPKAETADALARDRAAGLLRRAMHLDPVQPFADFNTFEVGDAEQGFEQRVRARLADIPGVAPLPLTWLVAFAAVYLFAIGPGDWAVLKLLRRQPLTWFTFPVLIVVFSGASLVLTSYTKGSQAVLVRVEVVDLLADAGLARGQTWLGIFATGKTRIGLQSGFDDAVLHPLAEPGFQDSPRVSAGGGPGTLSYGAETWTLAYARSDWTAPISELPGSPALEVECRAGDGGESCVARNRLGFDLTATAVLLPDATGGFVAGFAPLGALPAGGEIAIPAALAARVLTSGNTGDPLEFAARALSPSLPSSRGALDAEHRPVLIGVADHAIEPVVVDGIRPEQRELLVVRVPMPAVGFRADFDRYAAIVSFDRAVDAASGSLQCPDGSSQPVYADPTGVLRIPDVRPGCTLDLYAPVVHSEPVGPGTRLRCRSTTRAGGEQALTCSSTETPP